MCGPVTGPSLRANKAQKNPHFKTLLMVQCPTSVKLLSVIFNGGRWSLSDYPKVPEDLVRRSYKNREDGVGTGPVHVRLRSVPCQYEARPTASGPPCGPPTGDTGVNEKDTGEIGVRTPCRRPEYRDEWAP